MATSIQPRSLPVPLATAAIGALALVGTNASAGVIRLVSKNAAGIVGNGPSHSPNITPDGRFIAFESSATNLVVNDTNDNDEVFLRDTLTDTIERVSVSSFGAQANGRSWAANINGVRGPGMSDDGSRILFTSVATNLTAIPTLQGPHAFLRDRVTGTTIAIDAPVPTSAFPRSEAVALSGDGNHAIFYIVNPSGPFHIEWYVRDLRTGNALLLWDQPPPNSGHDAAISADGRWIVLEYVHRLVTSTNPSTESELVLFDRDADGDGIYDEAGAVTSRQITQVLNGESYASPKLSADGRFLAYTELSAGVLRIHRLDRDVDGNGVYDEPGLSADTIVGHPSGVTIGLGVPITPDGRFIAHKRGVPNTIQYHVNVVDVASGASEPVNFSNSTCALSTNAGSHFALGISADARFVTWDTRATDLDPADTDSGTDVYVVDRRASYPCDCQGVTAYGATTPNSYSLFGGSLAFSGSRSFALDDLVLELSGCPPGRSGVIFYGPVEGLTPFGNGNLYVAPGATGLVRLARFAAGANGSASVPTHHASTQGSVLPFAPGRTVYFQALYNDPAAGGAGFNTTNGLRFQFCP